MKKIYKFPKGFYWGAATASYQIEGGISNNDWAYAARMNKVPHAGRATNHYELFEEDFDIAKSLGQNAQRISIEWSRIEPKEGKFDMKEIEHYKKVLQALHQRGLKPFVTLWHFTLPIWFAQKGGFENKKSPEIFSRYCHFVVSHLKDYCVNWATMNEPMVFLSNGYIRRNWPPFKMNPFLFMKALGNVIESHNKTYKKIKEIQPESEVSLVKHNIYFTSNKKPWNKFLMSFTKWFWNHYLLQRVFFNLDSIGLNYYLHQQFGRTKYFEKSDMGWDLDPEGIYHVLRGLRIYNKPIYVSEAGIADTNDKYRAKYIRNLIYWLYQAIESGVDVRGYMYWSLIDNFEWKHGFVEDFGLVHVNDKTFKRTIRPSAYVYKQICENNSLEIE